MKATSKLVIEVLEQVARTRHLPCAMRLRGLNPSAVAFAFAERLIGYTEFQGNTVLSKKGQAVLDARRFKEAEPVKCPVHAAPYRYECDACNSAA